MADADPIQDFIDSGGFRAVPDPEGDRVRAQARRLVLVALGSWGRPDATVVVAEVLVEVLGLNRHGGGPVAAAEYLVDLLCHGMPAGAVRDEAAVNLPVRPEGPGWDLAGRFASRMVTGRLTGNVALATSSVQPFTSDDEMTVKVLSVLLGAVADRLGFFGKVLADAAAARDGWRQDPSHRDLDQVL